MHNLRVPVVVWEDYQRGFTASTVGSAPATAFDSTSSGAVSQVKGFLEWSIRQGEPVWSVGDWKLDVQQFEVTVWPEYETDHGAFALREPVRLRVAAVVAQQDDAQLCALPTLDVQFQCDADAPLKRLVQHYVQQALAQSTPAQLSRYLLPRGFACQWINVRNKESHRAYRPSTDQLENVAEPLGDRAARQRFSHAWQRDKEVEEVVLRLGKQRANILLVGESGVGKTTVLAAAVRQLERINDPDAEDTKTSEPRRTRFWLTSGARLIAGMQYLGQWEERCEAVIGELGDISGVLCIENLLELVRVGSSTPNTSVAAFLVPYLEARELQMVAEVTPAELDACRRLLPNLTSLFQIVEIDQFDPATARGVLTTLAEMLKQNAKVQLEPVVVDTVYRLFRRFLPYQPFPGGSITFLRKLFRSAKAEKLPSLSVDRAVDAFVRQTGLPAFIVRDEILLESEDVLAEFRQRVIGQDAACQAAAGLVTAFKAGLNDPQRPLGVHLYCGPTGVGKTELARTLGDYLFGHGEAKDRLIRLDMSEYSGYGAAERLFMQPDGRPSQLIRLARAQPFMVVLLDEIEKASTDVFDVLLGLFDEGRLTDRYGRTTTFRSAVIIMTSNLGADALKSIGFERDSLPSYEREAMAYFRPEFFNRFDAVVTFEALSAETIKNITRKELAEIQRREGLEKANIKLTWSEAVVEHIASTGFDPRYGARPLQRTLELLVIVPIATWLAEFPDTRDVNLHLDLNPAGEIDVSLT